MAEVVQRNEGVHQFSLELANEISNGIYHITLQTAKGRISTEMLVLKKWDSAL